jgi:hypothetical protein
MRIRKWDDGGDCIVTTMIDDIVIQYGHDNATDACWADIIPSVHGAGMSNSPICLLLLTSSHDSTAYRHKLYIGTGRWRRMMMLRVPRYRS